MAKKKNTPTKAKPPTANNPFNLTNTARKIAQNKKKKKDQLKQLEK